MKIQVIHRDNRREVLTIVPPCIIAEPTSGGTMSVLQSSDGTEHFFNEEDGTYDGWGRMLSKPVDDGLNIVKEIDAQRDRME